VWRQADKYGVPRLAFVNKMDIVGADFLRVSEMIHERLGANTVPVQLPIGSEADFVGVIDLLEMKACVYHDEKGVDFTVEEIPADMQKMAAEYRTQLIEAIAETDDDIMELYLSGEEPDTGALKAALRKACVSTAINPVFCGSAYKCKGIQKLLDAVLDYLPSPLDIPPVSGTLGEGGEETTRKADDNEPFSALAFKIVTDPHVGKLAFFRVYSGSIPTGSYVYNSTKGKKERLGRILKMHAAQREEIGRVSAGDIAAAIGLKNTTTGDTLCLEGDNIILESMVFPEPVISVSIEPKTKAGQERMGLALSKLAEEDPTFRTFTDQETGQTIISGMGELHLEVIVDRLLREFRVEANVGRPQVAYRETFKNPVDTEGRFVRQSGGRGQYAVVKIKFEPLEITGRDAENSFEFIDKIVGGAITKEYVNACEAGIREAMQSGVIGGYPVLGLRATLYDGSQHEVDSSEMAFKIAGSMAFKNAMRQGGPVLLEPISKVDVTVPEEYMGDVLGDLSSRRGSVEGMEQRNNARVINALVPLAEMFGYATDLRSKTQGRGVYAMEVHHYEPAPKSVQEKMAVGTSGVQM
jgi:elongation factor G